MKVGCCCCCCCCVRKWKVRGGQSPSYLVSLPLLQSDRCILLFINFSISNPSYKKPILYRIRIALLFVNHLCLVTKMSIETYRIFPPLQGICCNLVNHFNESHNSVCWRFTEAVSLLKNNLTLSYCPDQAILHIQQSDIIFPSKTWSNLSK